MDSSRSVARALKRIQRDLVDLKVDPIEGVGIARMENEFSFLVNIKILDGVYEGILLQFQMKVPSSYPVNPPEMLMLPNQHFSHQFHHHIYDGPEGYQRFCVDILGNAIMSTATEKSGWSPAYTFRTLLMQVQHFLGDPDMTPPEEKCIKALTEKVKKYSKAFTTEDGKEVIHTYEKPYPPLRHFKPVESSTANPEELEAAKKISFIKESLTCYHSKSDFITDSKMAYGYPLHITKTLKGLLEVNPIPELLSYEGYISQIQANPDKMDSFANVTFKTAMGEYYNYWLPIYINEQHFKANKTTILNSISVCKYGISGAKEYDFMPENVVDILPPLLNKMIIFLLKGTTHLSYASIQAYCHYIMLFNRLLEEFPIIRKKLKEKFEYYANRRTYLSKRNCPDIGNLIVLLLFAKIQVTPELMKKIMDEFFTRQMFWMFQNSSTAIWHNLFPIFYDDKNCKISYLLSLYCREKNIQNMKYLRLNKGEYISTHKESLKNYMTYKPSKHRKGLEQFVRQYKFWDLFDTCELKTQNRILELLFECSAGNRLLLCTFMAAKKFINEEYIAKLKGNYSIIDEDEVKSFINDLNASKGNVRDYYALVKEIGYEGLYDDLKPIDLVYQFIDWSNHQGYSNIQIETNNV